MPANYTVRINGVDRADTHVLLQGFKINEITNGINTLVCEVESEDASFRPVKRQTIEVEEDDGTSPVRLIFGGTIRMVRERGFGMTADGDNQIVQAVSADSYKSLASRRFVTETFPSQSLGTTFASVVNTYLAAYGVTVDAGQAAGPTLEALDFKVVRVDDVFNFLATLSAKYGAPFTWDIGYDLVAVMTQTGTVAAPWNVDESDFTTTESTFGDIEVEPTDDNYANKIILVWGSGQVIDLGPDGLNTPETFTGDGTTNVFPLKYQLIGPYPPPPLTSPPTASAIGYGYVIHPDQTIGFLGNTGTFGAEWEYDQVTNSISRVAGAPPLGFVFQVPYRGLGTGTVEAEDAAEISANGLWEDKILAPEIEDPALALTVAEAELERRVNTGRIVRFRTRRMPAPQPGQAITITVPKRNISGSFTVTDVATENDPGNANTLYRTVTCNSTIHEQSHQTLTRWWSEKDHAGIAQPAGASAVPDWPLNSVQFNDNWTFGGARHVLYGDLFWDQPDSFLGEVKNQGLIFNAGSAPYLGTSPDGGSPYFQPGGWGDQGHVGLTDPFRLEMGMLGSGDFSMDLFAPSDETVSPPTRYQSSILMNSVGDVFITAGTPVVDGYDGGIFLIGHGLPDGGPFADPPTNPVGVGLSGGTIGEGFISSEGLHVFEGKAWSYRTVNSLPFSIQVTGNETTNERSTYVVTAGTGTIFLPWIGNALTPNQRSFPSTSVGRVYWIVNDGGGTLTVDAGTAGTNINDAASVTLADKAAIGVQRHDDGWRILAGFGGVTGGGSSSDIQALLDTICTTRGAILYRNATDWVCLSPGTNGQVLTTNGAGLDPAWEDPTGGSPGSPGSPSGDTLHTIVVAASDESDTDNTVHNDAELVAAVSANTAYLLEMALIFNTGTSNTPDAKFNFTMPAGATLSYGGIGFTIAATATTNLYQPAEYQATTPTTELPVGVLTTATVNSSWVRMTGVLRTAGTAGNLQLQWAQNTTTGGTPTVRRADSYIHLIEVT